MGAFKSPQQVNSHQMQLKEVELPDTLTQLCKEYSTFVPLILKTRKHAESSCDLFSIT